MRRFLLVLLVAGVAAWGASAEDELRQAEKAWAAAVLTRDQAALERMLGDRLIYAHSSGVIDTKAGYLKKLKSGAQRYDGVEHQSVEVRVYGGTALTHSRIRMHGVSGTRAFDDQLMMLHVWVKQGGRWQLVGHQTTKLP